MSCFHYREGRNKALIQFAWYSDYFTNISKFIFVWKQYSERIYSKSLARHQQSSKWMKYLNIKSIGLFLSSFQYPVSCGKIITWIIVTFYYNNMWPAFNSINTINDALSDAILHEYLFVCWSIYLEHYSLYIM